jgi:hypothetical protein
LRKPAAEPDARHKRLYDRKRRCRPRRSDAEGAHWHRPSC